MNTLTRLLTVALVLGLTAASGMATGAAIATRLVVS